MSARYSITQWNTLWSDPVRYFDFHTHAFADRIAERAMKSLAETSDTTPLTDGTLADLKRVMAERGVDGFMVLPIATKPSQQTVINDWAGDIMGDGVYCCGSVHPDASDAVDEVKRIRERGLCGVKFHCEYQGFFPDETRMLPIYRQIAAEGMFAVFHGGWDPFSADLIRATPERLAAAAKAVPQLTFVLAHLGGMRLWDDIERHIAGRLPNVLLDVSVIAGMIDDEQLLRIIRKHGADRILFASDCPWDDPVNELTMIDRLSLTDAEKEMIYHCNAEKLLGIIK